MAATAEVLFVVPETGASPFGATSPEPAPQWLAVAKHLSDRVPGFDTQGRLHASVLTAEALPGAAQSSADLVVVLGVKDATVATQLRAVSSGAVALLTYDCAEALAALERIGDFSAAASGAEAVTQEAAVALTPWGGAAQGKRLSEQAAMLFSRHSSEDLLYALFFVLQWAPRDTRTGDAPRQQSLSLAHGTTWATVASLSRAARASSSSTSCGTRSTRRGRRGRCATPPSLPRCARRAATKFAPRFPILRPRPPSTC